MISLGRLLLIAILAAVLAALAPMTTQLLVTVAGLMCTVLKSMAGILCKDRWSASPTPAGVCAPVCVSVEGCKKLVIGLPVIDWLYNVIGRWRCMLHVACCKT